MTHAIGGDLAWYLYLAAIAAGFLCGFINTLAGSGSLVTLPTLLFMGLPANVANGTNRIGVALQSAVATGSFRQQGVLNLRQGLALVVPTAIGSLVGAHIALNIDEQMMRRTIGALMVVMLMVMLVEPKRWLKGRSGGVRPLDWKLAALFFAIGVYGGFIQVGVGVLLLAGLVLGAGYDLVRANGIKVLIVLFQSLAALIVFVLNDQVVWSLGLVMALGTMPGAWVAARMAVKRGAGFVRWILVAVVSVAALDLLGLFDLIFRLF